MTEQTTEEFMREHKLFMEQHKKDRKAHMDDMRESLAVHRNERQSQKTTLKQLKKDGADSFTINSMVELINITTQTINNLKKYLSNR